MEQLHFVYLPHIKYCYAMKMVGALAKSASRDTFGNFMLPTVRSLKQQVEKCRLSILRSPKQSPSQILTPHRFLASRSGHLFDVFYP